MTRFGWLPVALIAMVGCADADGDGKRGAADCDDDDPTSYKGAPEVCDGRDNDCNGQVDEGVSVTVWQDRDGDGFGDPERVRRVCTVPDDGVDNGDDCDDFDPTSSPDGVEVCDGADNDCDGEVDEGVTLTFYADADGDGHGVPGDTIQACTVPEGYSRVDDDCDDAAPLAWGGPEVCDGVDNDCDGSVDEDLPISGWPVDADGDGFGDPVLLGPGCGPVDGLADNALDCDDSVPSLNPDAAEDPANDADDDCDGYVDELAVPDAYPTVADALAASVAGEVIQLGDGLFATSVDLTGADVTLAGEGCGRTVLYGDGGGPTVITDGSHLADLTISGGTASGVRVDAGTADVAMDRVCVQGNFHDLFGGGIDLLSGGLDLRDSVVSGNLSDLDGGGVHVAPDGVLRATRTHFVDNYASFDGGAMSIRSGEAVITASVFAGNTGYDDGGALALRKLQDEPEGADVEVVNSTFVGNAIVYDTLFDDVNGSVGSAIYSLNSTLSVHNSLFAFHGLDEESAVYSTNNELTTSFNAYFDNGDLDTRLGFDLDALREAPRFVGHDPATPPADWDLRLGLGSPYIDVGDPGLLDPDGSPSDVGAFGGPEAPLDFDLGYADVPEADRDGDGMNDLWELHAGLAPWTDDSATDDDADGLDAAAELAAGTDPLLADTDGDGVDDATELAEGSDPLAPWDREPVAVPLALRWGLVGEALDLDGTASFDPDGTGWTASWSIEGPAGSAITAPVQPNSLVTSFVPDVVGSYEVTLTVDDGTRADDTTITVDILDGTVVPDDAATLTQALDTAAQGDTILIRPGTYDEGLLLPITEITLVGLGHPDEVVVSSTGGPTVLTSAGGTAALRQLTLTGGSAVDGGGVYCLDTVLDLEDVVITGNDASDDGGGLYADGCQLTLRDVGITDNSALGSGGGLALIDTDLTWVRGQLSGNTSLAEGGAMYVLAGQHLNTLRNLVVAGNAGADGIFWDDHATGVAWMAVWEQLTVVDNVSSTGLLHLAAGRARFVQGIVAHNEATVTFSFGFQGTWWVLYPALWDNTGATYGSPDIAPPVQRSVDPGFLHFSDDGDPTNDRLGLRHTSPLRGLGLPERRNRDGSPSDPGAFGGGRAPRLALLDAVDADGDGMSDGWERAWGLDPLVDDASGDADADGQTNLEEFLADTRPDRP